MLLGPFGYYVLDGWGGIWASQPLPTRRNPRAVLFADRWRGVTIIGGQPVAVRNDGTTVAATGAGLQADHSATASRRTARWRRSLLASNSLARCGSPPRLACRTRSPRLQDDDRAEHLAALHLVERVLHLVERDGLADEPVEIESARQIQVDEHREVA